MRRGDPEELEPSYVDIRIQVEIEPSPDRLARENHEPQVGDTSNRGVDAARVAGRLDDGVRTRSFRTVCGEAFAEQQTRDRRHQTSSSYVDDARSALREHVRDGLTRDPCERLGCPGVRVRASRMEDERRDLRRRRGPEPVAVDVRDRPSRKFRFKPEPRGLRDEPHDHDGAI